jgi:protein-S-isoprenylcysteine O-methyltransferase Ste14
MRVKGLAAQSGSPLASRFYRLGYNLIAVVSLLPVMTLAALLPGRWLYTIRPPWLYLTIFLQASACVMLAVGLLQTGVLEFLGIKQLLHSRAETAGQFITSGLYHWMRHPLYTAGLIIIWLAPVMNTNLLALNAGLSIYLVLGAHVEERKLVHEFGESYEDYRRRTPMFIPWSLKQRFKV